MTKFGLLLLGLAGLASSSLVEGVQGSNLPSHYGRAQGQDAHIRQHDGAGSVAETSTQTEAERTAKHQAWVDHWKNSTPEEKAALEVKIKDWKDKHPETPEEKAAREAKHKAWVDHWKNATPEEKAALEAKLKE